MPRDDFDRLNEYCQDLQYHANRLALEREIVARYVESYGDSSLLHLDLLQEFNEIDPEIQQLRQNPHNLSIARVTTKISVAFARTESRLADELERMGLLERQVEVSGPPQDADPRWSQGFIQRPIRAACLEE